MKSTPLTIEDPEFFKNSWPVVQHFFDSLPYPIFEIKGGGSDAITYCNRAFAIAMEGEPLGLIGQALSSFGISDKECARLQSDFCASSELRNLSGPYVANLKTESGDEAPMAFNVLERLGTDGLDLGCLIIAQRFDRSERDVSASIRQVFYEIVERSGEAIGIAADDGTFLYRNQAHEDAFGQNSGPVGKLSVADILVAPEKGQTTASVYNDAAETGEWEESRNKGEWVGLVDCNTPEGPKPFWIRRHHLTDPITGKLISFAFLHDYSKQIDRLNELAEAKQIAEQARQTQRHLFHTVSHDLRAILQAASLYLVAAETKITNQGIQIEEIGRANDAINSVQDHFQKILEVLTADATALKPKIDMTGSAEVLDYIDQTYRGLAEAKGIELLVSNQIGYCATDVSLMKRIVGNLVSNAIESTNEGQVRVAGVIEDDRCGISVEDTGVGIPEAEHEKIFDQFYRINPRNDGGLGVGLSISKQLCELLGHEIELTSDGESGSKFTVWAKHYQLP